MAAVTQIEVEEPVVVGVVGANLEETEEEWEVGDEMEADMPAAVVAAEGAL